MKVKFLVEEDFVNYKKPSMFIGFPTCTWKCEKECGIKGICQNGPLANSPNIDISKEEIVKRYISNPISKAIVFGGLEPIDQFVEVIEIIDYFRKKGDNSPFVIYTGYYPNEIPNHINSLKNYNNIIVKFGRFLLNSPHRFDEVLGVELASENQYAEQIS